MANPAYVIGKGEMLLITTRWVDGDVCVLETQVRCYTHEDIQDLIDETVSQRCSVVSVTRYMVAEGLGEDISEDFDIRTQADRDEDLEEYERQQMEVASRQTRRANPYSTINFAQTGVAGGYGR